jgi:predicted transcriptional regulator
MDLAARKYNFIQELLSVDESLLSRLEKVLKSDRKKHDWSLELTSDEQSEIEKGIKEADNNEFVSHDEVMKKFSKWH